jgi:hypothetical protein
MCPAALAGMLIAGHVTTVPGGMGQGLGGIYVHGTSLGSSAGR